MERRLNEPGWKTRRTDQACHPGIVSDCYFFFLPAFFLAFFLAATQLTSDRVWVHTVPFLEQKFFCVARTIFKNISDVRTRERRHALHHRNFFARDVVIERASRRPFCCINNS